MRRQQEYSATVVRNRNELIDATTSKTKVILIEGEVLETLRKEIKKERRTNGGNSAISKIAAAGAVSCLIPGINLVAIPLFLGIVSVVCGVAGFDKEHLKKYDAFYRLDTCGEVISLGLVWKGAYEPEDDLIVSPYRIALFKKTNVQNVKRSFLQNIYMVVVLIAALCFHVYKILNSRWCFNSRYFSLEKENRHSFPYQQ